MTDVETRMNLWEALAGRAPGEPVGPADPGLWAAVVERLDPARAKPVLRAGIEAARLTSVRGTEYVMLRSPDGGGRARYLRLTLQEWWLASMMDGTCTVARLVAEFARMAGRLAPDQVRRVIADLAGNRMLEELPVDAFRPLHEIRRRRLPARVGSGLLAVARGRRMLTVDIDRLVTVLYRAGGRLFFGRTAAVVLAAIALAGLLLFTATWWQGSQAVFLSGGSYVLGAVVLVLLNVLALASHELGHALATKHAGREVSAAGVLVYFGIPSVFVDTTDVWMAGRRARMLATAAGPATGLVLAGMTQLVGLAVPAFGPVAFKLAFVCYLNALFNLSPFLALDGYYLLMDWLEIPNLRARALSWVSGRLRGRPPRWSALDREGRIIALYGVLAVLWLAVAANLAYRIWADRVAGLATGLWHTGVWGPVLLIAVILGLCAPLLHLAAGRLARWWRGARQFRAERRHTADTPRRLAALRASELGGLPDTALTSLAARAHWLRPQTGRQLVLADGPPSSVYVVVDGALQGRRRGDPGGTIRHHVAAGGVVGLAGAITGRPARLDWHTAGTTLLSLPASTVSSVVGPLPGPPPHDRDEAEALFADTPALAALATDERLALITAAHPVDLEPGAPVILSGPTHAVVVESGVIAMPDGVELRRGTLVGPVGDGTPGAVAQARTPVRLWVIPDAAELPPLVGGHPTTRVVPGRTGPADGGHPAGTYPPLAVPPGPPDGTEDPQVDRRFERRMWWIVLLALLLVLLSTAANLLAGPAWAEMRTDRALLTADRGRMTVLLDGATVTLASGQRRYVDAGTRIDVPERSIGRLEFHGGSAAVLCAGSRTEVLRLHTGAGRIRDPHAELAIDSGRVLADTTSVSGAYRPLSLVVLGSLAEVRNAGAAWYSVERGGVTVSTGRVTVGGTPSVPARAELSCGDGVPVPPPAAGPSELPSVEPPSVLPSLPPSTVPTTAPTTPTMPPPVPTLPPAIRRPPNNPPAAPRATATTRPPATRPTTSPPRTPSPTPSPTKSPPAPPAPSDTAPAPTDTSSSSPDV